MPDNQTAGPDLAECLRKLREDIARIPSYRRALIEAMLQPPPPDPCPCPRRCDEAQTCTGWCRS